MSKNFTSESVFSENITSDNVFRKNITGDNINALTVWKNLLLSYNPV
jgi:hypothetical protein